MKKGRPSSKPKGFRDGFYIDVRDKRTGSIVRLRYDTVAEMERAAEHYKGPKDVAKLGEHRKGQWVNGQPEKPGHHSKQTVKTIVLPKQLEAADAEEDELAKLLGKASLDDAAAFNPDAKPKMEKGAAKSKVKEKKGKPALKAKEEKSAKATANKKAAKPAAKKKVGKVKLAAPKKTAKPIAKKKGKK
ncbi:MAG: hypothetical protein NTY88_01995 [Bacteroidetes bacterium]|nr:hypothetical protein [Bacteroidota bacterium]